MEIKGRLSQSSSIINLISKMYTNIQVSPMKQNKIEETLQRPSEFSHILKRLFKAKKLSIS